MSDTNYSQELKQDLYAYMWHDQHGRPMEGAPTFSEMDDSDFKQIAGTLGGLSILLRHLGKTIYTEAKIPRVVEYVDGFLTKVSTRWGNTVNNWRRSRR